MLQSADDRDGSCLPEIPATKCSYLIWENKLSFPAIFFGEIEPGETVDEDAAVAGGIAGDDCFIVVDDITLVFKDLYWLLLLLLLLSINEEIIFRIILTFYTT